MVWLRMSVMVGAIAMAMLTSALGDDRRDGIWWQSMPQLGRKFYLVGFLDGTTATFTSSKRAIEASLDQADCKTRSCYEKLFAFVKQQEAGLETSERQYDTLEVAQIEDAVDALYADPRNLRIPVLMVELVAIESIRGASKTDVERQLQLYRVRSR